MHLAKKFGFYSVFEVRIWLYVCEYPRLPAKFSFYYLPEEVE